MVKCVVMYFINTNSRDVHDDKNPRGLHAL